MSVPSAVRCRIRTLPGDIRATIGRRVELLAEDTRRMLAAASVLGRRFDVATLAATTRIDPDVVIAALAEAATAAARNWHTRLANDSSGRGLKLAAGNQRTNARWVPGG